MADASPSKAAAATHPNGDTSGLGTATSSPATDVSPSASRSPLLRNLGEVMQNLPRPQMPQMPQMPSLPGSNIEVQCVMRPRFWDRIRC